MQLGAAGLASGLLGNASTTAGEAEVELKKLVADLEYLTRASEFGTVERGNPKPYTLPPEKLKAAGMTRETWRLEVVPDPESNSKVERPLRRADGTALDFAGLMKLADKHAVRFLKVMTCNNGGSPLGTGLWEGVPLREAVWMARPVENVRRVFFDGYHNLDPKQLFRGSLPIGRVLEDPPGTPPVILCYKLNGDWISGKRGGPVRMVIPEAYGFRNIKWLNRLVLTNLFHANDTYARGNNDIDSWLKTNARFIARPRKVSAGRPFPVTGLAQVGISGLKQVQVWLHPKDQPLPADDPYFQGGDWRDMEILPAPARFGGGLPEEALAAGSKPPAFGFDGKTGHPRPWPLSYALAHWAGIVPGVPAGRYDLRCRTIDRNGIAQPLPRPFRKSGRNHIERVTLVVGG